MASEYLKWKYRDVKPDQPVELTAKERRANWWYYHKWHVVFAAVLLLALADLGAHVLGIAKIQPDYQIAYVGSAALPEDTAAALETALAELGTDCNGDGQVTVQLHQYPIGLRDGDDVMYDYASSVTLMADLEACDSYFFLLEDPNAFQRDYQILRRLDGTLPAETDLNVEGCSLLWTDCPALTALPLGEYSETVLGQELSGDSQALLSGLSLARRGFWTDQTAKYVNECDILWDALTKGALS